MSHNLLRALVRRCPPSCLTRKVHLMSSTRRRPQRSSSRWNTSRCHQLGGSSRTCTTTPPSPLSPACCELLWLSFRISSEVPNHPCASQACLHSWHARSCKFHTGWVSEEASEHVECTRRLAFVQPFFSVNLVRGITASNVTGVSARGTSSSDSSSPTPPWKFAASRARSRLLRQKCARETQCFVTATTGTWLSSRHWKDTPSFVNNG